MLSTIYKILSEDRKEQPIEKTLKLFSALLPKKQQKIFEAIPIGQQYAVSAKEIAEKTGIRTKNICTQINLINEKGNIIRAIAEGKNYKYYKLISIK